MSHRIKYRSDNAEVLVNIKYMTAEHKILFMLSIAGKPQTQKQLEDTYRELCGKKMNSSGLHSPAIQHRCINDVHVYWFSGRLLFKSL